MGVRRLAAGLASVAGGYPAGIEGADGQAVKGVYVAYEDRVTKTADWIKLFGVPDVIKEEFRQNSKWVEALDPDIAAKRSWSMSVKVQEQRQRNYQRQIESIQMRGWQEKKRGVLKDLLGFQWPF